MQIENKEIKVNLSDSKIKTVKKESVFNETLNTIIKLEKYEVLSKKNECVLKSDTLSIPEGKLIGIIGVNEHEKLNLMDSLAGKCKSTHTIYGHVYTKNKAGGLSMRRSGDWFNRVNYISQSAVDYENVPARSILVSIAKCNGMAEADVDNYMNTFGIERAKSVIF
ncbi:hypothetical protein NEQG_01623, partial [Nematocida parisii ERTm3]